MPWAPRWATAGAGGFEVSLTPKWCSHLRDPRDGGIRIWRQLPASCEHTGEPAHMEGRPWCGYSPSIHVPLNSKAHSHTCQDRGLGTQTTRLKQGMSPGLPCPLSTQIYSWYNQDSLDLDLCQVIFETLLASYCFAFK